MKIKRNLFPDIAEGAAAAAQPAGTSFFGIKNAAEAFAIEDPKGGDGGHGGEENPEGGEQGGEGKKAAEKKVPVVEKKEKVAGEEGAEEEPEGGEEGGEGGSEEEEVLKLENAEDDSEPETTWDDLAAEYKLPEIEDKTLQGQDKFNAQIEALKKQEREAGKAEAQQVELARYEPQAQELFHALNGGLKMEAILKPAHDAYTAMAMPDADLVKEHLMVNLKQTEEQATEQLEVLESNGSLGLEASKLRAQLGAYADGIVKGEIGKYAEKYKSEMDRIKKETERENQAIASEIRARTEYLGSKVPKDVQDKLVKRWESGQYKNLMQNSVKDVTEFIYWKEFGQKLIPQMKEKLQKDVKKETFEKLSRTPKVAGGAVSLQGGGEQDFSSWKGAKPTGFEYGKPN